MLVGGYIQSGVGVELTSNSMVSAPFVTSHKVDFILFFFSQNKRNMGRHINDYCQKIFVKQILDFAKPLHFAGKSCDQTEANNISQTDGCGTRCSERRIQKQLQTRQNSRDVERGKAV